MTSETIGRNLAVLRREALRTQEEVAKYLGISEPMVSSYERGKIKLPLIAAYKLANLFGCQIEDFLKGVDENAGQTGNA